MLLPAKEPAAGRGWFFGHFSSWQPPKSSAETGQNLLHRTRGKDVDNLCARKFSRGCPPEISGAFPLRGGAGQHSPGVQMFPPVEIFSRGSVRGKAFPVDIFRRKPFRKESC